MIKMELHAIKEKLHIGSFFWFFIVRGGIKNQGLCLRNDDDEEVVHSAFSQTMFGTEEHDSEHQPEHRKTLARVLNAQLGGAESEE